jgi:hypothetical protein
VQDSRHSDRREPPPRETGRLVIGARYAILASAEPGFPVRYATGFGGHSGLSYNAWRPSIQRIHPIAEALRQTDRPQPVARRPDTKPHLNEKNKQHANPDDIDCRDIRKMRPERTSSALAEDTLAISSERIRHSITAARVRAIMMAANSSGDSMLVAIIGAPVRPIEAG